MFGLGGKRPRKDTGLPYFEGRFWLFIIAEGLLVLILIGKAFSLTPNDPKGWWLWTNSNGRARTVF